MNQRQREHMQEFLNYVVKNIVEIYVNQSNQLNYMMDHNLLYIMYKYYHTKQYQGWDDRDIKNCIES